MYFPRESEVQTVTPYQNPVTNMIFAIRDPIANAFGTRQICKHTQEFTFRSLDPSVMYMYVFELCKLDFDNNRSLLHGVRSKMIFFPQRTDKVCCYNKMLSITITVLGYLLHSYVKQKFVE